MTDKKTAAELEVDGDTTVDYAGFTWPASPDDWPAAVTHAMENGKAITAIEGLLGPEQFKAWMDTDPTNRVAAELVDGYLELLGLKSGE